MPNKLILLSIILGIVIGTAVVKGTHAYFTASATSATNTFKTADTFSSISPAPDHVVINEVSPIGSSSAEWVELYNPTQASIDVKNWSLTDKDNSSDIFQTNASIPSHGFAVVITNDSVVNTTSLSTTVITLGTQTIGNGLNDNGDSLILKDNNQAVIDSMSYGNILLPLDLHLLTIGQEQTLQRFPNGQDTDTAGDWHTADQTLGIANQ